MDLTRQSYISPDVMASSFASFPPGFPCFPCTAPDAASSSVRAAIPDLLARARTTRR